MTPDDDFDSRFESFLAGQEGQTNKPDKAAEPEPPAPVAATPEGEPPAAEPVAETSSQEATQEPFPGYAQLPEETRKAVDAAIAERDNQLKLAAQRYQMLHGQVAPLQREVAALKRAEPKPDRTEPRTPEPRTEPRTTTEKWEKLKATLGEDAEAIEELLERRLSEIRERDLKPVSEKLSLLDKLAAKTEQDEARVAIAEAHENWESTIASDDFQDWHKYLRQTNPRLAARIRDGLERGDVNEHIFALDLYASHMDVLRSTATAPADPPRIRTPDPTPRPGRAPSAASVSHAPRSGDAFEDRWERYLASGKK